MRTDGAVVEVDVICVILCLPLICRCQSSVSDSLLTAQTGKESLGAECFTHTLDSTIYSLFLPLSFSLALSLLRSLSLSHTHTCTHTQERERMRERETLLESWVEVKKELYTVFNEYYLSLWQYV